VRGRSASAFVVVLMTWGVIMSTASHAAAADPAVTSFSPTSGASGTLVTLEGTGLSTATAVSFNGTGTTFQATSDTTITATVPEGASTGPITVGWDGGSVTTVDAFAVSPIDHVVIIDQENHSFDNVLGSFCTDIAAGAIQHDPCDGASAGKLLNGATQPLVQASDFVVSVRHDVASQTKAIDGGKMDGFSRITGCHTVTRCYSRYSSDQIPNIFALATRFAVSDRTFEFTASPSWTGHMVLASATTLQFQGNVPRPSKLTSQRGPGWGCDSFKDVQWWAGTQLITVPACIPDASGAGPYRSSPVPYVPTIFDRLDATGLSWRIYGGGGVGTGAYGWTICPTFFECLGSDQINNLVPADNVVADARAGALPAFSIVTPIGTRSQHNGQSMAAGDNWIGSVVGAIENGPDWATTAIFLTWDDCGCFYDHVPPPEPSWGIRVPMIVISPYAQAGSTDSNDATFVSLLAFTESNWGLEPLNEADASAYDYADSFDYAQTPVAVAPMTRTQVPESTRLRIAEHPMRENDPT
jgi:phospholipase C